MVTQASPAVIRPVTPGDLSMGRYGLVGQGSTTADTQAWLDACADVFAAGGGIVRIPPGRFLIEEPFVSTADIGLPDGNGVVIQGVSPINTVFETAGALFSWVDSDSREVAAEFRDFAIHMGTAGSNGTLIRVEQLEGGLASNSRVHAWNLAIRPADAVATTAYFGTALMFKNVYWPKVTHCNITQPRGGEVTLAQTQQGDACINVDGSYGPEISFTKAWGAARGLSYDVTANPGGEGGYIRDSVFVHNLVGGYVASAGTEPAFEVNNSHFNCRNYGLHFNKKKLVRVAGCLFYNVETSAYSDIYLQDCDDFEITDNRFHFGGNPSRRNIDVDATSTNIQADGNWHASEGSAHRLAAGASNITIRGARYNPEIDKQIEDLGAVGLRVVHDQPIYMQWSLAAAISVATDTDVAVTWDTVDQTAGFGAIAAQTITIPANVGAKRARIHIGATWANNSTGARQVRITKNNTTVDDCPNDTRQAASTSDVTLIGEMDVVGGDVLRVVVRQSSGGALDLSAVGTYVRVELV